MPQKIFRKVVTALRTRLPKGGCLAFHRAVRPGSTGAILASLPPPQLPLPGEIYLWEVTLDGEEEEEELELPFDQTFGESMKIVEKGINSEYLSIVPWKAIK